MLKRDKTPREVTAQALEYAAWAAGLSNDRINFRLADGAELLARVFLIEPSEVELKTRTKGASKRRPNLTYEELRALATGAGVDALYDDAVAAFEPLLQKHTTRSSINFAASFDGSRKTVISLLPGESSASDGLRYHLYKNRYSELTKLADIESLMPLRHEPWVYWANAGPDWEGYEGFMTSREEIERIADALSQALVSAPAEA